MIPEALTCTAVLGLDVGKLNQIHPAGKLRRVRGPGGRVRRRMARRPGAAGRRVGRRRCGQAAPEGGREGRPRRQDRCRAGRDRPLDPSVGMQGRRRESPGHDACQEDQGGRRRGGEARFRDKPAPRGRDLVQVPHDDSRHRGQDRIGAGHRHRHLRLPRPRPPRVVLRHRAQEPPVGNVHIVGQRVPPGQQEAQEPADILVQQPGQEQ